MAELTLRSAAETRYDAISLGEVMLRIDPGAVPMARARTARILHGGGETNVTEGLRYCFGLRTAVVTALVNDGDGRNIENQLREAGIELYLCLKCVLRLVRVLLGWNSVVQSMYGALA